MRRDDGESTKIRTLQVEWSDTRADYVYTLKNLLEYKDGSRELHSTTNGDLSWATSIAEHYKIDLPKVEEEA